MMKCEICREEILGQESFCPKCGEKIIKKCPQCGKFLYDYDDECKCCGWTALPWFQTRDFRVTLAVINGMVIGILLIVGAELPVKVREVLVVLIIPYTLFCIVVNKMYCPPDYSYRAKKKKNLL